MSDIYLTKESFESAQNIIIQYLRDAGYEGSMEDGTGIFDAVIKPNALLYSLYEQELVKAQAYMSLDRAQNLRSVLSDDEYDSAVDGVLSNWFVTRSEGTQATGMLRLYFSKCPEYLGFKSGETLAEYDGLSFLVSSDTAFGESSFHSIVNTTRNAVEYYVDVPVVAAEPSDVFIAQDASFSAKVSDIYFLRAQAVSDFTSGTARESSEAFIQRAEEAITTRELITSRALHTVLPDTFPEIRRIYVAGHGVSEMMRDVKEFAGVAVHVGNMADIWVASELVRATEVLSVSRDGSITLANSPVHISGIVDNRTGLEVPFTMSVDPYEWLRPGVTPVSLTVELPTSSDYGNPVETQTLAEEPTEESNDDGVTQSWSDRYTDADGNTVSYTVTMTEKGGTTDTLTVTTVRSLDGTETVTSRRVVNDGMKITVTDTDAEGHETVTVTEIAEEEPEQEEEESAAERTVTVTEYTSSLPARIQDFIYGSEHRVASYDPQLRMMVPVVMHFDLKVTCQGQAADREQAEASIKKAVTDYIREISFSGAPWSESEMLNRIHEAVPSVYVVRVPVNCRTRWFDMDSSKFVEKSVNNTISFSEGSRQITENTTQIYTDDSLITVEFV